MIMMLGYFLGKPDRGMQTMISYLSVSRALPHHFGRVASFGMVCTIRCNIFKR
jgi:hypothetical protein